MRIHVYFGILAYFIFIKLDRQTERRDKRMYKIWKSFKWKIFHLSLFLWHICKKNKQEEIFSNSIWLINSWKNSNDWESLCTLFVGVCNGIYIYMYILARKTRIRHCACFTYFVYLFFASPIFELYILYIFWWWMFWFPNKIKWFVALSQKGFDSLYNQRLNFTN